MEIKRQYDHGKLGNFLFDICASWTKFLLKHRWLYYLLAFTWGLLQTVIGFIITLVLLYAKLFFKDRIHFKKYKWIYAISAGPKYWGGFSMGLTIVRDQKSSEEYLNTHEFGHSISQLWLGPFFLFTVGLHSSLRYWVRKLQGTKDRKRPPYDQYWAEDAASQCGEYAAWYIDNKNNKEK